MNKSKNKGRGGGGNKKSHTKGKGNDSAKSTKSPARNTTNTQSENAKQSNSQNVPKVAPKVSSPPPTSNAAAAKQSSLSKSTPSLPPPPPDPLFVLRGTETAITAVQFISPALRLDEMSPSHAELLRVTYGNLDSPEHDLKEVKNSRATIMKTPPPGFLHSTAHVAAGTQNGEIAIWDLKTKEMIIQWKAHERNASVITLKSMSPNQLISFGRGDSVKLWHLILNGEQSAESTIVPAEPREDNIFENGIVKVICISRVKVADYAGFSGCDIFRHFGCIVTAVPGPTQDAVTVWKLNGEVRISELRVNEISKVGSVMHLKWIEKRGQIALLVAYESGDICLWDWSNRDLYAVASIKDNPVCVEYDQTSSCGVIGTVSEKIYTFTINLSFQISIGTDISITNEGIGTCISRPDGKIYVTGGWDNNVRVYSWQQNKLLAVLNYHHGSISSVHFSSSRISSVEANQKDEDSKSGGSQHILAAGSTDASVSLWKLF